MDSEMKWQARLSDTEPRKPRIITPQILKILLSYGARAKSVIPELERTAAVFAAGENDFPKNLSLQKAADIREAILTIRASNDLPPLIHID